jgi:hypothetical protein
MNWVILAPNLPETLHAALEVLQKPHPGPGAEQMPSRSTFAPHGPRIV